MHSIKILLFNPQDEIFFFFLSLYNIHNINIILNLYYMNDENELKNKESIWKNLNSFFFFSRTQFKLLL